MYAGVGVREVTHGQYMHNDVENGRYKRFAVVWKWSAEMVGHAVMWKALLWNGLENKWN